MADIVVSKVNESTAFAACRETIAKELSNFLAIQAPNFRWAPAYKAGYWDGKIRFFTWENQFPIGLLEKVREFARLGKYSIEVDFQTGIFISRDEFAHFVDSLHITNDRGEPMEPYDYQLEAAFDACHKRHICMEVPTAGGKTLISYIIARFFAATKKKLIIVVSTTSIVEQTYSDFFSYGWKRVSDFCHRIYAGQQKLFNCPITITTWQSLLPLLKDRPEMFEEFDGVLIDEAHGAKATSLKAICAATVNAQWRMGLSGTYPDPSTADWYTIVGGLGPVKKFISYKELQDRGNIAKLKIINVIMKYPLHIKRKCYEEAGSDYPDQSDFIHAIEGRNDFIVKLVRNLDKNTLVLFTKVEKHGIPLREKFERELKGKHIIYIDGNVDVMDRELARAVAEKRNDVVILASYGTFSTGINIKNIHYVVFASGYKSRIKVLQSIGRGLRKLKDKMLLTLYDLVDDLSFTSKKDDIRFINHSVKHYKERIKIYHEEEFEFKSIVYEVKENVTLT